MTNLRSYVSSFVPVLPPSIFLSFGQFFFEQLGFNRYVVRTSNLNVRSSDPDKYGDVFAFPGGELQEWDLEYQPDYDGFR